MRRIPRKSYSPLAQPHRLISLRRTWGDQNIGAEDVILTTIAEHHANIVPWQQLAGRTGCKIIFIPINADYTFDDQVVIDHLDRYQPKLFAFTAASNVLGTQTPVKRWVEWCGERGIKTLIDASQLGRTNPRHPVAQRRLSGLWRT